MSCLRGNATSSNCRFSDHCVRQFLVSFPRVYPSLLRERNSISVISEHTRFVTKFLSWHTATETLKGLFTPTETFGKVAFVRGSNNSHPVFQILPIYIIYKYRCPRRNVPDFGRVFLMLKYTDITQNTYVQSWTVTEIIAREKCGLLAGPRTAPVSWQPYLCYVVECGVIWRLFSSR